MANERSHRTLFIHEAEIVRTAPTKESRFRLKIAAGNKEQKTEVVKIDTVGVLPKWTMNMNLDFDPQTIVSWELYGRRRLIRRFKLLGSAEKTLGELFERSSTSAVIHLFNGTSEIAMLKISGSNSAKTLMDELVPSIKKPSESSKFLDNSETLWKVFGAAKEMIDLLAEAHPAANVAWGFLSIGFKVLQNQRDTKQAVLDLYVDMISVYEEASKKDILQQRDGLQGTYSSLFKQTIECAIFIEGYTKSGIGRVFTMDISGQAEKFRQAFADLKDQLTRGFARESAIVTLGVQELVNVQMMRDRLRDLQPPEEFGPKSRCTPGTRVETINTMVSWIAKCNGEMMWCKGLAGTGKSSLMGTLHDLLTADIGGRSRLAAFVRYDRIEYSNASKLITSIAYALGMFDDRIGMAISKVIQTSRSVATMSDRCAQFRLLLRKPLESVPDLVDEGPLVVIVDGLDESDASNEALAVLAEGFGPKLPFMRLIVSSRPVHRIATVFGEQDCIYPLHLDTSSMHVNRDIRFYLEREFATIHDNVFQDKCKELDAVNELAARASGLFIWAATVAKFVCAFPAISRLQALLATEIPNDATEALTTLYHIALNTLVSEIPGANADIKKYVRNVLGAVLVAKTPPGLTEAILDTLVLDEGSPPSSLIMSMLGSVVSPETERLPIRLIHKSLDDFLQDPSQSGDGWFVDVTLHQQEIAKRCLDVSTLFLQEWTDKVNVDVVDIPVHISQYALFGPFWHIATFNESGLELFTSFFRCSFLPWLDVHLCIGSDDVLQNLSKVLNWSNQFGSTLSRTLFYHAYLFADRAIQDRGQSHSGPSYIYTGAMSLSPSSNVIRKAWEQSNNILDSPTVSSDKERLLTYMTSQLDNVFIPDSDSLMTIGKTSSSLMITQWEIDTGQQKSLPKILHAEDPFFNSYLHSSNQGHSTVLYRCTLVTPPPTSESIMLPLHDYVSHETIDDSLWLSIGFFDSQTQVFKMYTLLLSHFSDDDFSLHPYDNGFVLAHNVGFFMKITIGQEDSFVWTPIPVYQSLDICRDGSIITLSHHDSTIQLYDTQTGAAVFNPLQSHTNEFIMDISNDGPKIALHDQDSRVIRVLDITLGGKVTTVIDEVVDNFMPFSFVGGSKIAYILQRCLIIQSVVTGSILFRYGIPKAFSRPIIKATPDGGRVVIYEFHGSKCMVWDVRDL
ncbi:hypothetical protein ARMSODRAFT_352149 [Armillaria solidipes]|uniref:Nephrocystin 3-like N-terminal domain-containing protein n=1 Tax=Armillaria solidipes TaxID=1076256 RepID=A0A2H3BAC2_9AGAR|nr:hypothetical protein ARMSODRAFT_352149 [Armillaria solidipes]